MAVTWLYLFVDTFNIAWFPWQVYAVLFGIVWGIYSADRIIDSFRLKGTDMIHPRHVFHYQYRFLIGLIWLITFGLCAWQILWLPASTLEYAVIAMALVALYFFLTLRQKAHDIPLIKNTTAGLTFGYGTSMCALIFLPHINVVSLLSGNFPHLPMIISFSVLCILNITAIDFWQISRRSNNNETKASIELFYAIGLCVLVIATLMFSMNDHVRTRHFYYAIIIAASCLLFVNKIRSKLSLDLLRVLADAVLIVPLPFYLLMKNL